MGDRATLKAFFETGDFPTEAQFADLIDQTLNIADDGDGAVGLKLANVSITSAELLAINTTPKIIVAAPGATKVVIPIITIGIYTFVTTAYATGGQFLGLYQTDENGINWANYNDGFTPILTEVSSKNRLAPTTTGIPNFLLNTTVVLTMPVADPTLGDGTFRVIMLYREITL